MITKGLDIVFKRKFLFLTDCSFPWWIDLAYEALDIERRWTCILIFVVLIPQLCPFVKLLGNSFQTKCLHWMINFSPITAWVIYHLSNNPTIFDVKLTCFSKRAKMDDAQLNGWQTFGNIAIFLNLIGEALPQLIIRYVGS